MARGHSSNRRGVEGGVSQTRRLSDVPGSTAIEAIEVTALSPRAPFYTLMACLERAVG